MKKDFDNWNKQKKVIHDKKVKAFFQVREVWWCALGVNVGFEQDGGSEDYSRPVVIIKKFNNESCLVVPLTSRPKSGKYFVSVGEIEGKLAVAILSQLRFVDQKRLENKLCMLNKTAFEELIMAVVKVNFEKTPP